MYTATQAESGRDSLIRPGHLLAFFVENTIIPMVEGVKAEALQRGFVDIDAWTEGIEDLHSTVGPDGTFCYAFFTAVGVNEIISSYRDRFISRYVLDASYHDPKICLGSAR